MNAVGLFKSLDKQLRENQFWKKKTSNIKIIWKMKTHKMLLCSHSPNVVPPLLPPAPPQRNVSIAAVRGAVRPPKTHKIALKFI